MAIIAVGDLDLDKMEMELKTRFSKIPSSPASARARTKYEVPLHEDTKVLVATDKEAPYTQIQVINKFTKKHLPLSRIIATACWSISTIR